ncbi:penicillin-binding protein 2 [Desulfobacteraceae bacterium SEEP-SAG9]|nr:penicillin-binding protein 2 [Desulfobacteraceae bacterium SEEP-SAG9]
MAEYLKSADSDWYRLRLTGAILCVTAAFVVLFLRLFYLQVIDGEELRRLSENNCIRLQNIDPPRGLIFDRNGKLLVDNRASFDLSIILKDAKPIEDTINKLSRYTKTSSEEIQSKIARSKGISNYKPVLLKQDIGRNVLAAIEVHKYDLPGVCIDVKPRRHYINKQSAAHLIGYLSEINSGELKSGKYPDCEQGDFIGKFGAEKAYEQYLRGKRGGRQVEVNANGQVVRILNAVDTRPGFDTYVTIDQLLQKQAEKLLEGLAGAVVAMEPGTGRLLAMASSPSFDQNDFVSGMSHEQWGALISNPLKPMSNKAVQGEYPPASTFKIVTAIAGLEEGVIDADTTIFCPGFYKFGNRVYQCWKKGGHGSVNVISALAESCDCFFYQVGQKLGIDRLAWYAKAFGLGSPTGINLDHEAPGLVPTAAWKKRQTGIPWQAGETLSVAIGQGYNLVTPLQMAGLISAIGNGGDRYRPLILKKIVTSTGKVVLKGKTQVIGRLPASPKTLELVRKGLWEVVNGNQGTARGVRVAGIDISGKTGTAQIFSRKTDEVEREEDIAVHLKSHAWFVAYAPSEDPVIAVAVVVEHGEHGSSGAGPIAKELIRTYLIKDKPGSEHVVSRQE